MTRAFAITLNALSLYGGAGFGHGIFSAIIAA
jgi:hypothetical protein